MKLLINGSLVRAQQAEPINQGLSEFPQVLQVLNLEPVLNSPKNPLAKAIPKDHFRNHPPARFLLSSSQQITTMDRNHA